AYTQVTAKGPLVASTVYQVNQGMKRSEIGAELQDAGIVSSAGIFTAAAFVRYALGTRLKAGEYEFPPQASTEQVLNIITSGRVKTYKLTVPEGWTTQMAVARIIENDVLAGEITAMPVEGAIMPETYLFPRGRTRQKIVDEMQAAQTKMLDELWSKRSVSDTVKTKEQAVTLASIVEKETAIPEERPLIASVFHNRLKQGMRLQSDPTIIYGLVGGKGKLDRGLTKDDVASDTAYNTYKIDGLPPGPIANPGRASLEAVLNPPDTGYLYFVADGSGGHAFAKTLEEHNANVAKWRAIESTLPALPTTVASTAPVEGGLPVPPTPPAPVVVAKPPEPAPPVEVAAVVPAEPPAVVETSSTSAVIKPVVKPTKLSAAASLEPGTWLMVANQLVPIPKQKPRQ
ncbi:MAG: endolytic transglycosylase MltG, partial [Aestuariivirga sp.]